MRTFESKCTLPPESATSTFVSSPNTRGTLDILWSCLSVLFLCTWSVLHLNVPTQYTPITKGQKYGLKLSMVVRKFKWMIINLLAPEIMLGQAWSTRRSVALLSGQFSEYQRKDGVPWSRSHIYYVNMGGFAIQFDELLNEPEFPLQNVEPYKSNLASSCIPIPPTRWYCETPSPKMTWKTGRAPPGYRPLPWSARVSLDKLAQDGYYSPELLSRPVRNVKRPIFGLINWAPDKYNTRAMRMAISMVSLDHFADEREQRWFLRNSEDWFYNIAYLCGNIWVLDANQLLLARKLGIIEKLPSLSQSSLDDRNKGNLIVTVLALAQILWLVIQLFLRWTQNFPSSQLEIITLAFAICSVITYILLVDKPKDVQTSCTMTATKRASAEDLILIANAGPTAFLSYREKIWIPSSSIHRDSHNRDQTMFLGCIFALIVFGATHCFAWNFKFPTDIEKTCWHISSVITASAFLPMWALLYKIYTLHESQPEASYNRRHKVTQRKIGALYLGLGFIGYVFIFARLFILVEAFRSLAFLPPGTFSNTESAGIPHVG